MTQQRLPGYLFYHLGHFFYPLLDLGTFGYEGSFLELIPTQPRTRLRRLKLLAVLANKTLIYIMTENELKFHYSQKVITAGEMN